MADFLSNLAGQALGAAPEVWPLLPHRFAPDPSFWRRNAPGQAAETGLFMPALVNPENPAVSVPLPTFRQMSALTTAPGPPAQPGQALEARGASEAPSVERGADCQPEIRPTLPAERDVLSGRTPPAPVTRSRKGSHTGDMVIASPDDPGESGGQPSAELVSTGRAQALPPPQGYAPQPALPPPPKPATGQERSTASAGTPGPAGRLDALHRHARDEPGKPQEALLDHQLELASGRTKSVVIQPAAAARQPEPSGQRLERPAWHSGLAESPAEPVKPQYMPAEPRTEHSEDHPKLVKSQSPPIVDPEAPIASQPERGVAPRAELPVRPAAPASPPAPPPIPPDATGRVIGMQTKPVPGEIPIISQAPQSVSTAGSDLPASIRAVPIWREPVVVPMPEPLLEPALRQIRVSSRDEETQKAGPSLQLPLQWPARKEPEQLPTVCVTIGRVVVRASPAAGQPPSQPVDLPRPPVSLDEYLKGRKGKEK